MKLLIIDGSNVVMRCAFGGEVQPVPAVTTATNMIARAARHFGVSHLVLALDCPGIPSWRKKLFPDYKAHRTVNTYPWIVEAASRWCGLGWWVEAIDGYEADDIIATVATRVMAGQAVPPHPGPLPRGGGGERRHQVLVLSGDSDVLPLVSTGAEIIKPANGGQFEPLTTAGICAKYGVASPAALVDLKAMTGEKGDNVPGVDGIGPVRAQKLLFDHQTLEGVIEAGKRGACKYSMMVTAAADVVRLSKRLVSLVTDVPLPPIKPSDCVLRDCDLAGGAQ